MTDQNNVPKLRFCNFEAEWALTTLGELCELPKYGLNSAAVTYDGKNKYIRITDIDEEKRTFSPKPLSSPNAYDDSFLLKNGDIVFARTGASVGKSYLYKPADGKLYFAGFLIKFCITKANSDFVFNQTLTNKFYNWVRVMSVRSGQPGINANEFSTYPLVVPTTEEQEKIASFLSEVDKKIDLLTQKKAKLTEYKKGVMQQLFNGKFEQNTQGDKTTFIPPSLRFKDGDGNEFPDWEDRTLSSLTTKISDGIHSTPIYDEMGDYFFVNGNNLKEGRISIDENTKRVSSLEAQKHSRPISENTIFMSINGTIGNMAFYDNQPIMLGKSACYINVNPDMVDKRFVYAYLQQSATQFYFTKELTGSTIKNLSLKTIKATVVMTPTIIEQQKISEFLSVIYRKVDLANSELDKAKKWKKGLLQQMFV